MAKLSKEQRRARDDTRVRERLQERRENGFDVVAYALANRRAYWFLTEEEKHELRARQERSNARLNAERNLELAIADVMLRAMKDNTDPYGAEAQAIIRKLKSDFRKAFPAQATK